MPLTMWAALAAGAIGTATAAQTPDTGSLARIVDDSAHRRLVITLGPVMLPAHASHHEVHQLGLQTVTLPAGGWLQGYLVELTDSAGRELPRELIHHVEMIELERRALLDSGYQRIVSVGKETPTEMLPEAIGYPVRLGERIGINAMLVNPTATPYPAVFVRVALPYVRADAPAPPLDIYTVSTDVTGTMGRPSDYDVPSGSSRRSREFTFPIAGWLLAVGGHLHDYGRRITLVSLSRGDTVYDARATVDSRGRIVTLPMGELWRHGGGYHLSAGERFRLTAVYDNPTGRTLPAAGMGWLGGVFKPDSGEVWPSLDPNAPVARADLAYLRSLGSMDMGQMKMP